MPSANWSAGFESGSRFKRRQRPTFRRRRRRNRERGFAENEARAFIHLQNAIAVYYFTHRAGALDAFLKRHPERRGKTPSDSPDLTGVDMLDPAIYDARAGDVEGAGALTRLQNIGVQIVPAMDADLWQDAARLKSQFRRVSVADCLGVALARRLNATFVTSDRHELQALDAAGACDCLFIR